MLLEHAIVGTGNIILDKERYTALEQKQSFSKNSHSDLDLEPRTLNVEHAQDI